MISSTDANGGITQNTFDPAGNRIAVVDPDNNKTTFVFDALNRETSDTNALNFTESFTWDPSSDMTSMTDRDGRVRDFQYDNLHRQTAEDWMNGSTVAYAIATAYDADNEITSTSDPDRASAVTYDNLGDALTVDNAGTPGVPRVVLTSGLPPRCSSNKPAATAWRPKNSISVTTRWANSPRPPVMISLASARAPISPPTRFRTMGPTG